MTENRKRGLMITDVSDHRKILSIIFNHFRLNSKSYGFSPWINSILFALPRLSFVPCFLLSYLTCRYGELKQVSMADLKSDDAFIVSSSKSKHKRVIPAFAPDLITQLSTINDDTQIHVSSYSQIKKNISESRHFNIPKTDKSIQDCTHIFRHLQATWWMENNVDKSDISYRLGHTNPRTMEQYIHDEYKLFNV